MVAHIDGHVAVVSSNDIFREGLRHILAEHGLAVVGLSGAPLSDDAVQAKNAPALLIIDASAVDDAIETCGDMRSLFPAARIVMMSDPADLDAIARSFAAGADAYLAKNMASASLVGSLKLVLLGEKIMPSPAVMELASGRPLRTAPQVANAGVSSLTERELEILGRLVRGEPNKLISRALHITEATVKVHVKAVLRKLKVANRTQAAIWAMNHGLVTDPAMERQAA